MSDYGAYYIATSEEPKNHLFLVGILKSYEYVCFDRTLDAARGIFEFYVPQDQEETFLYLMGRFEKMGVIKDLQKLPNRLIDSKI